VTNEQRYRIALRDDDNGDLDDVVINDVSMFRAERMDGKSLWMACYFPDSDEHVTFWVRAKKGKLLFSVTEQPPPAERFIYEDDET
jgi:hypothetical protein